MLNRYIVTSFVLTLFLSASAGVFASTVAPATKTASADVSPSNSSVIYKRKQESNAYPIGASSYENNFLKNMMGVGMQTPATRKAAGTAS